MEKWAKFVEGVRSDSGLRRGESCLDRLMLQNSDSPPIEKLHVWCQTV